MKKDFSVGLTDVKYENKKILHQRNQYFKIVVRENQYRTRANEIEQVNIVKLI